LRTRFAELDEKLMSNLGVAGGDGMGGPVALNARAQDLYGEVMAGWSLDGPAREMLRLACESLTRADEAAAIVTKEGQVFRDRWGQVRPHPAAVLERDHRQAAARVLQSLGVSLEGGA
jgi:hypothetical protein